MYFFIKQKSKYNIFYNISILKIKNIDFYLAFLDHLKFFYFFYLLFKKLKNYINLEIFLIAIINSFDL